MTKAAAGESGPGITALLGRYPDAETIKLHPADVPFFVHAVQDAGQAGQLRAGHRQGRAALVAQRLAVAGPRRALHADQVCIIPGTQSVAGITRSTSRWAKLLDRFEQASIDDVLAIGRPAGRRGHPSPGTRRCHRPVAVAVLDAPDVLWAGRTSINPVHRIGAPDEWQVNQNRSATHPSTGARLERSDDTVTLSVPLSDTWIKIRFTLPSCTVDGGMPVVTVDDASTAMRSVLAIAAGADGPDDAARRCTTTPRGHRRLGSPRRSPTTPV